MSVDVQAWLSKLTKERKAEIRGEAERRLNAFSQAWAALGNSSLTSGELALLRTYLVTEISGLLPSLLADPETSEEQG